MRHKTLRASGTPNRITESQLNATKSRTLATDRLPPDSFSVGPRRLCCGEKSAQPHITRGLLRDLCAWSLILGSTTQVYIKVKCESKRSKSIWLRLDTKGTDPHKNNYKEHAKLGIKYLEDVYVPALEKKKSVEKMRFMISYDLQAQPKNLGQACKDAYPVLRTGIRRGLYLARAAGYTKRRSSRESPSNRRWQGRRGTNPRSGCHVLLHKMTCHHCSRTTMTCHCPVTQ